MSDTFSVKTTSASSAKVEDLWLNPPEDPDSAMTRRVVRPELVDNAHSDEARVKITIVYQRRHKKNEPWQDYDTFNLGTLKAGQEMKLHLNAFETYHLYKMLEGLHRITESGIPQYDQQLAVVDESEAVVVKGRAAELVRQLTEEASDEFWDAIQELQPYLFRAVALTKLHEIRENAVNEFQGHLEADDWSEGEWQKFFERSTWIFGYGLNYRFLSTITPQPEYGGRLVTGKGGQRGDFLTATEADRRFTVLVEIKRPDSLLVEDKLYRNKVHILGEDLTDGVAQLQSNCRTWELQGSRDDDNRELLEHSACYTIQPKGILIIGHTEQLNTNPKRTTFELFRRNMQNPEIITFDELLGRANHLLLKEAKEFEPLSRPSEDLDAEPL
jgi:hypothetical protein